MPPRTEILVHISGPCGASDDARYRREARGYLQFQTATRNALHLDVASQREGNSEDEVTGKVERDDESDYGDIDLSHVETPGQQLRRNAQEALQEPLITIENHQLARENSGPDIFKSVSSSTPAFTQAVKTKPKFSHIHVHRTPAVDVARTPADVSRSQESPSLRQIPSNSRKPPSSVIPDSQPLPRNAKRALTPSPPSPTNCIASLNPKRRCRISSRIESVARSKSSSPQSSSSLSWNDLLTVHPPPPPIDTASFTTHFTLSLHTICDNLSLSTFYIDLQRHPPLRSLLDLERGHWRLSLFSLTLAEKEKAWKFLEEFIRKGCAGWGVWSTLQMEKTRSGAGVNEEANKIPGDIYQSGLGVDEEILKIYCWGELVPAIWFLLFLATNRKAKVCGAQWIDASGKVVVQMK